MVRFDLTFHKAANAAEANAMNHLLTNASACPKYFDHGHYELVGNYIEAFEANGVLLALRRAWFRDPSWIEDLP